MGTVTSAIELDDWIPFRVYFDKARLMVDWCHLGDLTFSAPFFNQTIDACLHKPFNLLFRHQTPIETLVEMNRARPGISPSGFIFHMSRCGSTLVAQMLSALSGSIVISEAPPIDFVIRAQPNGNAIGIEQRGEWLRGLINVLGHQRKGKAKHYFIKFDAWHMLDFPLIRRSFPEVPWIFLYRDPIEVLVSQMAQPSAYLLPSFTPPDFSPLVNASSVSPTLPVSFAMTLAKVCEAALHYSAEGGELINYRQLPEAVSASLLELFGVSCSADELAKIAQATRLHAKNPFVPFAGDSKSKQQKATAEIREAAQQWLYPLYHKLEAARIGRVSQSDGTPSGALQFKNNLTQKIADFLTEIGLEVVSGPITRETFLPGIFLSQGKLLIDEDKLLWPGDLLHEAGHLAVAPAALRPTLTGEVILPGSNLDAIESQAMAWSYAATLHLGLDPKTVFHEGGYRGHAADLLRNFDVGVPLGVNGLQEAGLTMIHDAGCKAVRPYPHMLKWLRD
jgi:hypothetical protein